MKEREKETNRHFMSCSTKTNASTETSDSGAHDNNFHCSGQLEMSVNWKCPAIVDVL